jgi:phospholipid/cholesterol/gamma-HCH transport system substrate-binding protein
MFFFYHSYENFNKKFQFVSMFNYVEGLSVGSNVEISGLKIGEVSNISLNQNGEVTVKGFIDSDIDIPDDSILLVRSNGIFGKKSLLIEPGFGDSLNFNYIFTETKDSYSIDMLLRYLEALND